MTHHLWSQTEMAFMFIRRETGLTGVQIARVVNACFSDFKDQIDLAIADVRPGIAKDWCDEAIQVSAKLSGATALLDQTLSRGKMDSMAETSRSGARAILGKTLVPGSLEERRLSRSLMRTLRNEMRDASDTFAELGQHRPETGVSPLRHPDEYDVSAADHEALRAAKVGENVADILVRLNLAVCENGSASASPRPEAAAPGPHHRNAGKTVSALWQPFCDSKVTMKEWKPNQAISSNTTLRLWIQLRGDLPPRMYTAEDASLFHQALSKLPSKYHHNKGHCHGNGSLR